MGVQTQLQEPGTLFSAIRLLPPKNVLGVLKALAASPHPWKWVTAGDG